MKLQAYLQTLSLSLILSFLFLLPLTFASVEEWTDAQLERVNEVSPEINRIYLFYADWCGACRRYKPKFAESCSKISLIDPNVQIIRIDLDKAPLLGSRFRLSHLPSIYHQFGGEFRKIEVYQNNLENFIERKAWKGLTPMDPLSPPRTRAEPSRQGRKGPFFLQKYAQDLGINLPVFIFLSSTILLFIVLFAIWCIWLYTDYKLNAHNFTEEAIKERIKFLRKQPEYADEFDSSEFSSEEDSGEESDTETSDSETRGRRRSTTIKNRLK